MLDDSEIRAGANTLWDGFRTKVPQTPLSITYPDADFEDAYRIQERFIQDRLGEGHEILGYKVGLTSRPMREQAGIHEPDYSAMLDFFFYPANPTINMSELVDPAIGLKSPL